MIGITGTDEKTKVEEKVFADKIIVATGGKSYPVTGSTGDGYKIAKELGHTVTDLKPSLVPLKCDEQKSKKICQDLQGLSLRNVSIKIKHEAKIIYEDFGEMLFTHLVIDLKPSLTEIQLDSRILRDFNEIKNKQFKNSLEKLLPQKMITPIIVLTGINPEKRVNEITKEERAKLVKIIKNMELNIKEINPKTMESKIINGVFFAGEVIDLDAYTGGFNLQIAWSTGYVAGNKTI